MERNRNGGFTLLETLLTVAILVILLGVSAVGVAYHRDYLKVTELDNAAREIYMAAENRAVLLQNSGASVSLLSLGGSGDVELSKTATQLNDLLPKGTIDPALWSGDFRVVYDQATGHVKEVFYAKEAFTEGLDNFRKSRGDRVSEFRKGDASRLVGWYKGGLAKEIVTKPLPTPGVEVFIDNSEELTLTVKYTLPEGLPAGINSPEPTSVKLYYPKNSDHPIIEFPVPALSFTDNTATYEKVLDSLESGKQFKDLKSGLTNLGGDFKVTAGLTLSADNWIPSSYYAEGTDNSLFAKGSNSGADQGTAYIANLRHLQNLYLFHSKASGVNTKRAVQIAAIYGTFKGALYEFKPIHNMDLRSYNGYTEEAVPNGKEPYVISGLTVTKASADERGDGVSNLGSGLFGFMSEDFELRNVRLFDSSIEGRGWTDYGDGHKHYGFTGALVGNISSVTMENCRVKNVTVKGGGSEDCDYIGGLLGRCWYTATLKNCVAENVTVTGSRTAGGLVGLVDVAGGCDMENCRVYWTDPGELVEGGKLQYKIHGRTYAGGLIGEIRNNGTSADGTPAVTIKNSFAATTIDSYSGNLGNTGGLVGYGGSMTIENSYADCYLGGKLNVGGLVSARNSSSVLKLKNSYAAGFIVKSNESPVNGGSAGLCNSSATASNCYSAVRVMKADGTLEKPATPMYSGWNESSPGSAFYLSKADEVAGAVKAALDDNVFEYEDDKPETHVYDLRHRMNPTANPTLRLTPPYPFPGLLDTDGTALPHYSDWAELENKAALELVYYEGYDGAYGLRFSEQFTAANPDSDTLTTGDKTVRSDGYALALKTEGLANLKTQETKIVWSSIDSTKWTWVLRWNAGKWQWGRSMSGSSPSTWVDTAGFEAYEYTLIPLPVEMVYGDALPVPYSSDLKLNQKLAVKTGTNEERVFYFNPHFFAAIQGPGTDGSAAVRPADASTRIIIRTPRHFYDLSRTYRAFSGSNKLYYPAISSNKTFIQPLDLDYAEYTGPLDAAGTTVNTGDLPFKQDSITDSGNPGSSDNRFSYDGQCHRIRNVFVKDTRQNTGLFRQLNPASELKNIVFEMDPEKPQHMGGSGSEADGAGALLGYSSGGKLTNCAVYGVNITANARYIGGLVGYWNKGDTFQGCSAEVARLDGSGNIGGLVGVLYASAAKLTDSYAVGYISKTSDSGYLGGLVGSMPYSGTVIDHCYAAVRLEGGSSRYGLCSYGTVTDSYWLKGYFKYRGETYSTEAYSTGRGTAITDDAFRKLSGFLSEVDRDHTIHYTIPYETEWRKDYVDGEYPDKDKFPYFSGVKNADGEAVHYGLWPIGVDVYPEVSMFYYEKYAKWRLFEKQK